MTDGDGRRVTAGATNDVAHASVVLASASLVEPPPDADAATERRAAEVDRWAGSSGLRLVALPSRGVQARPDADAAERRRLGRRDEADLRLVLDRLRRELGPNRAPAALILAEEDVTGQSGRAWLRRLTAAAITTRIQLPRAVRVPLDAGLDTELLQRRILDVAS